MSNCYDRDRLFHDPEPVEPAQYVPTPESDRAAITFAWFVFGLVLLLLVGHTWLGALWCGARC